MTWLFLWYRWHIFKIHFKSCRMIKWNQHILKMYMYFIFEKENYKMCCKHLAHLSILNATCSFTFTIMVMYFVSSFYNLLQSELNLCPFRSAVIILRIWLLTRVCVFFSLCDFVYWFQDLRHDSQVLYSGQHLSIKKKTLLTEIYVNNEL